MKSCRYKSCDMSHINHEHCVYLVCNLSETLEIYSSRICRCTCDNHLWLALKGDLLYLVVIDEALVIYSIRHYMEI